MRLLIAGGLAIGLALCALPASAGPPYVTDDPEPTEAGHYEIYLYAGGSSARDGSGGAGGIDFNYGAAPDLQLTAVVPLGWDAQKLGNSSVSLGNIELAAKYKFLNQDDVGFDVALFPRVFLPAGSGAIGERHVSLLLPIWIGRSWDNWSAFGGGGCTIDHGGGSQNFCQIGVALTEQVTDRLQLGAEIYHQTADAIGGRASTGLGIGATYDATEHMHLMASFGPGVQNAGDTGQYTWYLALQLTL
ncbi:MAG: transporter [Proteobacteria bacterium]|nr:transporter [Pseudomonadota bacterium]